MRVVQRSILFILVIIMSLTTLFIGGCTVKEKLTEEQAMGLVTECFEILKENAESQGFLVDLEYTCLPTFDNDERWCSTGLFFTRRDMTVRVGIGISLEQKYAGISFYVKTNENLMVDGKVTSEVETIINWANLVSEKQFTVAEFEELLTNDKNIRKFNDSVVEHKVKYFNFWSDIAFNYWEYKNDGDTSSARSRFEYMIESRSKQLV